MVQGARQDGRWERGAGGGWVTAERQSSVRLSLKKMLELRLEGGKMGDEADIWGKGSLSRRKIESKSVEAGH